MSKKKDIEKPSIKLDIIFLSEKYIIYLLIKNDLSKCV